MKKLFIGLAAVFFSVACSMAEADVVEETLEAAEEVDNYSLTIVSATPEQEDNEYTLNIDLENTEGYIISDLAEEIEGTSDALYYNSDTVYEHMRESGWEESSIQVNEMHEFYFVDYRKIAQTLDYIEGLEEGTFEEVDDVYEFSYKTNEQSEAETLLEEWGFNFNHIDEQVTEASIQFHINKDTFYIEDVELSYTMNVSDNMEVDFVQTIEYQDINETEDIEVPEGL